MCLAFCILWNQLPRDTLYLLEHNVQDNVLDNLSPWGRKYLALGIFLKDPILQSIAFHSLHNGLDNLLGKKDL